MVSQQSVDDTLNEIKQGVEAASEGAEKPLELSPETDAGDDEKVDIAAFEASGKTESDDEAAVDDIDLDALLAEVQADDEEGAEAAPAAPPESKAETAPAAQPAAKAAASEEPVYLNAIPSAKGLQVGFPMEILAEALRPLVSEWVIKNLPAITERLVREEITRLTEDTSTK